MGVRGGGIVVCVGLLLLAGSDDERLLACLSVTGFRGGATSRASWTGVSSRTGYVDGIILY
jgi:hypothetical protein